MAIDVSFAQFDAIASGDYNAGQIDYKVSGSGVTLKEVNAHVHFTSLNTATIDVKRVVEIKRAFVRAMESKLGEDRAAITAIRKSLGLPPDDTVPRALSARTIEPLTRQEVRAIIDKYVKPAGGANARPVDADVAAKRDAVNLQNLRALPIRIGGQSFRLDKMAAELTTAVEQGQMTVTAPTKTQAAEILKTLTRPNGTVDIPTLARSLNVFAFMAEQTAASDKSEGAKDAGERLSAAFAQALDSLDNGTLSQVYQGLISRDADDLKNELSRRLAKFDLTADQADMCERTAFALGRLECLVLNEISHRVKLGMATKEERAKIMAEAPVLRLCGKDVPRDLSARNNPGEMTSVNLAILTSRAGYGSTHGQQLTEKTDRQLNALGFTKADAHEIGDMIRKSELTVNAHLSNLLGWREGQDPNNPPLFQPGYSLVNTFVSKEQKGIAKDSTPYLVRRNQVEKYFFPEYGEMPKFEGKDRPNYAAFNMSNTAEGAAPSYGGVVFVMKEHVKQQATYTLSDTFFALKFDFTNPDEGKDRFLESAKKFLSKLVKPEAFEQLADPRADGGRALDSFLRMYSPHGIVTGKGLDSKDGVVDLASFLNNNLVEGAREIGVDDVLAVLFDAIGVKDDPSLRVAGYDNIENLLNGMEELEPLLIGLSTVRRAQNPGESVRLAGGEYIEAQLHGPIVITRDVEEMRVLTNDIKGHYRDLAKKNPAVTGGMAKDAWIDAQIDAEKARLLKLGKDNGFKVTFYEGEDGKDYVATENLLADIREVKRMMQTEHAAYFHDLIDNHTAELFAAAYLELSTSSLDLAKELFGEGLSKAPEWLRNLARSEAGQTLAEINDLSSTVTFRKKDIRGGVISNIGDVLNRVLDTIGAGRKLGATDNAKLLDLVREGIDSGVELKHIMKFVSAKVVQERIAANPQALIKETLEKELAGRKDEIAALGIPGGFVLGGTGLNRILDKIQAHLAKFSSNGEPSYMEKCMQLVDEIREKIVAPEINARLDHLKALGGNPIPDEHLRKSYYGWALNATRIKSAEEAKGVKSSAESLYAAFSTLLSSERDFGTPALVAAMLNIVQRISEACVADEAANYQGDGDAFGVDDRNGYIKRAVTVGLAAIEAKMGRPALEKLGRILGSPAFTGLRSAMMATMESSGQIHFCYTLCFTIADRLKEKYGIASAPVSVPDIDYSQVPPNVRSLLSAIDSDCIAQLEAKTPYAPQTVRPMPPAADPEAAPKTLAQRKRALFGALPVYGAHEQKGGFDYGRNMHGRGHATRVFIFANVLGNIMRERVAVDMGSLSTSAAGHDMGRQGSGTDVWEKDSGNLVAQLADQTYPGAYGDDWKAQTKLNVSAGHGAQADAQRSVEGLLMKAADSLDYTRVAPLNEKRFHFLEKTLKVGGVHVMRDDVLRKALLHEAELLSKATDPLAANREEITRLKASEDEVKRLQGQALEVETTKAEIALSQLTDEQLVEQIEAEIRGNPAKYPLLTKYYLNGDSIA